MPAQRGKSIAVVAAGNWLVSWDRVGPRVLAMAEGRYGPRVELCEMGTAPLALLDHLHTQDLMIIVDAGRYNGPPGDIQMIDADNAPLPPRETSTHQLGPLETLAVARQIYPETVPRRVVLLLVQTDGINDKEQSTACQRVLSLLDHLIEHDGACACSADLENAR